MIAEIEMLNHSDYVFAVLWIIILYVLQKSNLNHSLLFQLLLISHYFKGNINIFLVVKTK